MPAVLAAILFLGSLAGTIRLWFYAADSFMGVLSAILYLPYLVIVFLLLRAKCLQKVGVAALLISSILSALWIALFGAWIATDIKRPGHEADGMFGVLFLIAPLVSSVGASLLALTGFTRKRACG